MYPTITVGPFAISSFGLMIALALGLGGALGARQAIRAGVDWHIALDIITWGGIAGVLGAKAYSLVLHPRDFATFTWVRFRAIGLVWYGGVIAGVAASAWRFRRTGLPVFALLDQGAPALAAAHAVGRVGCLLAGDDYGFSTPLPWGISLPTGAPPSTAAYLRAHGDVISPNILGSQIMSVHPVMIYEAIGNVLIAMFLWRRSHGAYRPWSNVALYCVCYGTMRFALEFLRPKDDMLRIGLTVAQVISLGLIALGLSVLGWKRKVTPANIREQLASAASGQTA